MWHRVCRSIGCCKLQSKGTCAEKWASELRVLLLAIDAALAAMVQLVPACLPVNGHVVAGQLSHVVLQFRCDVDDWFCKWFAVCIHRWKSARSACMHGNQSSLLAGRHLHLLFGWVAESYHRVMAVT